MSLCLAGCLPAYLAVRANWPHVMNARVTNEGNCWGRTFADGPLVLLPESVSVVVVHHSSSSPLIYATITLSMQPAAGQWRLNGLLEKGRNLGRPFSRQQLFFYFHSPKSVQELWNAALDMNNNSYDVSLPSVTIYYYLMSFPPPLPTMEAVVQIWCSSFCGELGEKQ